MYMKNGSLTAHRSQSIGNQTQVNKVFKKDKSVDLKEEDKESQDSDAVNLLRNENGNTNKMSFKDKIAKIKKDLYMHVDDF